MDKRRLALYIAFAAAMCVLIPSIFFLLYVGISYSIPVTSDMRLRFAFWNTVMITCGIFVVMFWKSIRAFLDKLTPVSEDEDEKE
jgi:hypothetical protein